MDSFLNSMFSPFHPHKYSCCKAACGYNCLFTSFHIFVLDPRLQFTPLAPVAMATTVWHWRRVFLLTTPPVPARQRKCTARPAVRTVRAPLCWCTRRWPRWTAPQEPHHQLFHSRSWVHSGCFGWTALTLRTPAEISGHARWYTRSLPVIACLWCTRQF